VPLIVIVFANHAAVTPAGKPVAVPIPVAPVVAWVILVNAVLIQSVGLELAVAAVFAAVTIPLATTFCVVAPVEVIAILPLGVPVALVVKRTKIVVLFTVPAVSVKLTVLAKPLPDVVLTSNPVGGVITKLAVKSVPLTVKICCAEAMPIQVTNAVKLLVVRIVDKTAALVTVVVYVF